VAKSGPLLFLLFNRHRSFARSLTSIRSQARISRPSQLD
jgi:hypothetical protein